LLFWDNVLRYTPAQIYKDEGFHTISTNPCSEITLSAYDSCRLLLLNLTSFVDDPFTTDAVFNYEKFGDKVVKAQRLMDDLVDLEIECIDKILAKITTDPEEQSVKRPEFDLWQKIRHAALAGRRTGLGITGLGDTLAMLDMRYGSEASIEETGSIYRQLALSAYESSCYLARERGVFGVYDFEKEQGHPFMERLFSASPALRDLHKRYGRRNIALTTTAPCGSVSTMTQTTSGIEPAFMLEYTRRKKINYDDLDAEPDFIDDMGDKWQEFQVYHHGFEQWMRVTGKQAVDDSPYKGSTAGEIDWEAAIDLQAAAQKWVCHAISKTINLPADVSIDDVKKVYWHGWKQGLKGVTVYRDGSRSGVLISKEIDEVPKFKSHCAPKRPEILDCEIHHTTVKGEDWTILVGLMDGRPYEIMGGLQQYIEIPKKHKYGELQKHSYKTKDSRYDLVIERNGDQLVVKDIVKMFDNPNHSAFTRTISLALRHGAKIQYVVEQLQKDREADMFSFAKVTARVLKKYIANGTKVSTHVCENCSSDGFLVYQEGCVMCTACGYSKCS
jgi:ribonucleoside-diphosphate reductase alpha chain